jgi:mono/diheme cytochrome c family protein
MRTRPLVLGLVAVGVALAIVLASQRVFRREEAARSAAAAGRALYVRHCAVCHGPAGKGDGPGATVVAQRIRDFSNPDAMRGLDDPFLFAIIQKGGSQFGRSNAMPAWGMQLSDDQIRSLVQYIRSLAPLPPGASGRKETP